MTTRDSLLSLQTSSSNLRPASSLPLAPPLYPDLDSTISLIGVCEETEGPLSVEHFFSIIQKHSTTFRLKMAIHSMRIAQYMGTLLLFAAFVLLLTSCLTTPIGGPNHDFSIAKAVITDRVLSFIKVKSHLQLGVFGYCYTVIGKTQHCSSSTLGYELPPLFAILGEVTGLADETAQDSLRSVTKAFVLHPLSCGITFVSFIVTASQRYLGHLIVTLVTILAFVTTLATLIVDIVFFFVAKDRIEAQSDRLAVHVSFSTGTWLTVTALICEFVGILVIAFVVISERRRKRRGTENYERDSHEEKL
ncbi:hypothetical protein JCM5350_006713 [Sporobolomyces pararoseus]